MRRSRRVVLMLALCIMTIQRCQRWRAQHHPPSANPQRFENMTEAQQETHLRAMDQSLSQHSCRAATQRQPRWIVIPPTEEKGSP